ncbi:MAG: hypothetical protein CMO81_07970 [Waddliaceae bacterium]|nr:hypothetical protein [Waddliaceae bacterium]
MLLFNKKTLFFLLWGMLLLFLPLLLQTWEITSEASSNLLRFFIALSILFIFIENLAFRVGLCFLLFTSALGVFMPNKLAVMFDDLDHSMRDFFYSIRGPKKPSGEVVIVDWDHKSLQEGGQWPWPRTKIAAALRKIQEDGSRVIGLDVIFAEPDRMSAGKWIQRLKNLGLQIENPKDSKDFLSQNNGLSVTQEQVRKLIFGEWRERLEQEDPNFFIDESTGEKEQESALITKFLERHREEWEFYQKQKEERALRAGMRLMTQPYSVPNDPMKAMTRLSNERFLFRNEAEKDLLQSDSQLVMDNDYEFARVIRQTGTVLGGMFFTESSDAGRMSTYVPTSSLTEQDGLVISAGISGARAIFPALRRAYRQVLNVPIIQNLAYHQGMLNIVPDKSGSARWYTMLMEAPIYQETLVRKKGVTEIDYFDPESYDTKIIPTYLCYPSLALEMFRRAKNYDRVEPAVENGQRGLLIRREKGFQYDESVDFSIESSQNEYFIPLDFKADLPINFYGYGGAWQTEYKHEADYYFPYVSMIDVIKGEFEPGTFKDKYVLLGSTDPTLSDLVGSPFRSAFPGVEVHATVLDNLIQEVFLRDLGLLGKVYTLLATLTFGLIFTVILSHTTSFLLVMGISMSTLIGIPLYSYWGLVYGHFLIDFVYSWLCFAGLFTIVSSVNFFIGSREGRFLTKHFTKMVSADVLEKLRDDPEGVSLQGQKAEASIMFSDIKGFTSISEQMDTKDLVTMLNDYFTPMAKVIMNNHGFIDKFIGDAIMACWGVPYPDEEHAKQACISCLEQQKELRELSNHFEKKYGVNVEVRMGIASGEISAALMGSEDRKSYTVMGDVVNLGARLEPACKDYGADILLSETTYQLAKDVIEVRCVDKLLVKGKTLPVRAYQLMGLKGKLSSKQKAQIDLFDKAIELHWERKWEKAKKYLNELLEIVPDDLAAINLKKRIEFYEKNTLPDDWTGIFERRRK